MLLLLPTSTTSEMTLGGGPGIDLMLLLVSLDLMGTSELRLGGAKFSWVAAVLSKLAVLITNFSVVKGVELGRLEELVSRVRFLARSKISSTFCSPILLDSEPGLKVGKGLLLLVACCLVIRYEVLPVRAFLKRELPGLGVVVAEGVKSLLTRWTDAVGAGLVSST